jgi:hypothetical protein
MLVIRKEQIQRFIATNDEELAETISHAVRSSNRERVIGINDEELVRRVLVGIERARAHELKNAEDIGAFVAVMFAVSPRFDEQKEIAESLKNPLIPPEMRLEQSFHNVPESAWLEAERMYDPDFWHSDRLQK